ncbi:MarC family protein [Marispirochaeta sp.]|jgi:multiple antibiotic resistance protein|uniref:MarC family protein n=1 Tax=Marispirochaeta sp. TaxID=2038653 RepID=UPI0029C97466|nr:MarC family protein [Marispirochaeta sp.]
MHVFIQTTLLILILLNPFLVIVYLIDVINKLSRPRFLSVLVRAGLISTVVFSVFAVLGDAIFTRFLQADFASFQIFGGVIFLLIGIQFVFQGNSAIEGLRGESEHIAGAIAMPIMIGPGTISISVLAGQRLQSGLAVLSIVIAMFICVGVMMLLRMLHDYVRPKNEKLIERYTEIAGRITSIVIGTFAVEMIMQGLKEWIPKLGGL